MATYSRTISRIITDSTQLPAWRRAMIQTDRLYYVSDVEPGHATGLSNLLPNGKLPSHYVGSAAAAEMIPTTGPSGIGENVFGGYASGTLIQTDRGPYGSMVYGTGGHDVIENMVLGLDLNTSPYATWFWWQQPQYQLAAGNGAELYYSPTEYDALPANRRLTYGGSTQYLEVIGWDGGFPLGKGGWIIPRKVVTGQMGNNVPHGFRSALVCYVSASVSGSDPLWFTLMGGSQGPWNQGDRPYLNNTGATVAVPRWFDASAYAGTVRRKPFYIKNLRTGAWSEYKWQPLHPPNTSTSASQTCGTFSDIKRVQVVGTCGDGDHMWHVDMSAGWQNLTISSRTLLTGSGNANLYTQGAWSDGYSRHLVWLPAIGYADRLVLIDCDAGTRTLLNIGQGLALPIGQSERIGLSYDPAQHRLLVVYGPDDGTIKFWKIKIPADPTNAAGYVVAQSTITLDDPAMATLLTRTTQFAGKTALHPTLGVIFVPVQRGRMLGFVPGP